MNNRESKYDNNSNGEVESGTGKGDDGYAKYRLGLTEGNIMGFMRGLCRMFTDTGSTPTMGVT